MSRYVVMRREFGVDSRVLGSLTVKEADELVQELRAKRESGVWYWRQKLVLPERRDAP